MLIPETSLHVPLRGKAYSCSGHSETKHQAHYNQRRSFKHRYTPSGLYILFQEAMDRPLPPNFKHIGSLVLNLKEKHLFIQPRHIEKDIGLMMFCHVSGQYRELGTGEPGILSDPHTDDP